jgi:hypothetical protein
MNKLEALRLTEVTTDRQQANGTRSWWDPIAECYYNSYSNGYIRRAFPRRKNWLGFFTEVIYQLNPTRKGLNSSGYEQTIRIMIMDEESRINKLANAVINYRKKLTQHV